MAYSLLALRQALAEEAFAGQFPIRILTTGAGSATSVVIGDLAFGASGGTANQYHGGWIYNAKDPPVAPFSSRVLQQAGFAPATGTLTVAPAFGGAPGNGAEIIFCYDLHPDELHRAINRILRNLVRETFIPISLLANPDIEVDTTNWTPTTATLTRITSAVRVRHGAGSMQIAGNAGAPTAESEGVRTTPGDQLILAAYATLIAGTITLVLAGESGEVSGATASSSNVAFQELIAGGGYVTVPVGSDTVTVRLKGSLATDSFFVDDIILWPVQRKWFILPSYVRDPADIVDVGYFPRGRSLAGTNSFQVDEGGWESWPFDVYMDTGGAHPLQLQLKTPVTRPLFARVRRNFDELTTTAAMINAATNTTDADRDTVVQGAMHYIERARYAKVAASNPQLAAIHLGRSREYAQKFARMRQAQGYGIVAREVPQARTTVAMS